MKENMIQIIKCNYYFSRAKKPSNSVILVLGDFIKLLIITIFASVPIFPVLFSLHFCEPWDSALKGKDFFFSCKHGESFGRILH